MSGSGYVHLSGGDELVLESLTYATAADRAQANAMADGATAKG